MNYGNLIATNLVPYLEETKERFKIDTVLRMSHFLSQIMHESGDFKIKEENLNYSAIGLAKTWRKTFAKTVGGLIVEPVEPNEVALSIAKQPQKIASLVYANKNGNGDIKSGEGWKYRGRGFIQITGKTNYSFIASDLGIDCLNNPDLLLDDHYAMLSAGSFWNKVKLNEIADAGNTDDVIRQITKRINGGYIGLDDRMAKFRKVYEIISELNK